MVTLYNVISSDGFIATEDGSEDFIPDELWPVTLAVFKQYDALVMGRKTYDALQKYDQKLLGSFETLPIKKTVVTHAGQFSPKAGYIVAKSAEEALQSGANILISSGPDLISYLFEHKYIDAVILHEVPVRIGNGIRPFDLEIKDRLIKISESAVMNGIREYQYRMPPS